MGKSSFGALEDAGGSSLGFGILILIVIWSLVSDIPMIQILALYLDFEGAKNIHVLYVLIWGFGGRWRFLMGVWHFDKFHFDKFHFSKFHFGKFNFGKLNFGKYYFGKFHFGKFHFGMFHFGKFHFGKFHFGKFHFGKFHYSKFHFG